MICPILIEICSIDEMRCRPSRIVSELSLAQFDSNAIHSTSHSERTHPPTKTVQPLIFFPIVVYRVD